MEMLVSRDLVCVVETFSLTTSAVSNKQVKSQTTLVYTTSAVFTVYATAPIRSRQALTSVHAP